MRTFIIILIALCASSCRHADSARQPAIPTGAAAPDPVTLLISDFELSSYPFQVSRAILLRTPRWRDDRQFPPLSPRKAEAAALRRAQQLRPDVIKWHLEDMCLRRWVWFDDDRWYYLVTFWRGDIAITGLPSYLQIPVLMDGTAVQAANRPEKK